VVDQGGAVLEDGGGLGRELGLGEGLGMKPVARPEASR
jgi:hypothetical protein